MTRTFQMRYLHEVTLQDAFLYIRVKIFLFYVALLDLDSLFGHDSKQLFSDVITLFDRSEINKIVIAPIRGHLTVDEHRKRI